MALNSDVCRRVSSSREVEHGTVMWTCQPCIEPLEQLTRGTQSGNSVVFNSREDRRADENLATRLALSLGVDHARNETIALRAQTRQSFVDRAHANVPFRLT